MDITCSNCGQPVCISGNNTRGVDDDKIHKMVTAKYGNSIEYEYQCKSKPV